MRTLCFSCFELSNREQKQATCNRFKLNLEWCEPVSIGHAVVMVISPEFAPIRQYTINTLGLIYALYFGRLVLTGERKV
jgi:hypothetical protein